MNHDYLLASRWQRFCALHDRLVGSVVVVKGARRTREDEMPDVGFSRF